MPCGAVAVFSIARLRKSRSAQEPVRKARFAQKCRTGLNGQMLRRSSNCGLKRFSIAGILRFGLILIKRPGRHIVKNKAYAVLASIAC
ncbi:MAG: hypothetical protein AAAC47_05810, partial [Pararhizobium sp.]